MSEEENKAYLRPKFNKEDKTEEKVTENKQNERTNSKGLKRIALFHVNGNGDPDETQRASPQVQAYLKAFEQMDNVIVDIYPDNEAKFNLPYQYVAPFPVQVTDHLYWSETTLDSFADDIWDHWKANPQLFPSLIITIGPGSVYVCNTLFERHFWKIPWIYHGHWNITEIDRKINPDYFRVEDYALTSADAIVYNNIDERSDALILREQSISERHIVIDDLQMFLDSIRMESEEKYNEEEKNNQINVDNYYGVITSNSNTKVNKRKDILKEGDIEKQMKSPIVHRNTNEKKDNDNGNHEEYPNKLKSKQPTTTNPLEEDEENDVVDQDYRNLTPEQKDEWMKRYGINEEELIGKHRDAYDAFIDKYTNLMDRYSQYQEKVYTRKQSCPYYVYQKVSDLIKYQERKKIFGWVKLILSISLLFAFVTNLTKNYDLKPLPFTILYSAYLVYILVERVFVNRYRCGLYENITFVAKIIGIAIAIFYRNNEDIRCVGTGTLLLLVDGFWNGLKEGVVYELNLKFTIVKLLHVMFVRLILFPIWFFVGLMSKYKFIYFVFFGLMYLFNWNISYKVLEEYLFLLE